MRKIIAVLLVFILFAFCGCGTSIPAETDPSGTTGATEPNLEEKFTIPGTLTVENFDIKFVSAEICKSVVLNNGVDFSIDSENGKELLVLSIDATNTSNELLNLGSFISYADSVSVFPQNYLGKYNDRTLFVGAVHPGKTMQTYIIYQIAEGWESFELSYVDNLTMIVSKTVKIIRADLA